MDLLSRRSYRGPLKGAILDWAGTTVDYGSFAPTAVFIKLFASRGIEITPEHARGPMGLMKKDHLSAIAHHPEVEQMWQKAHGKGVSDEDINAMFSDFVPMQMQCLSEYADVIPGVPEAIASFRQMGMKIGSTTGYTHEMMDILVPAAKANGYSPDAWVSATDVPAGRPYPWMVYLNAVRLQVYPLEAYVKIGDTLVDVEEGLNAGMWTIGLAVTGNMVGMTEEEVNALSPEALDEKRQIAVEKLYQAGAHYVADGLSDCLPILEEINTRLRHGERPQD
jgi:phosphonoacetaldehyde hydrolase